MSTVVQLTAVDRRPEADGTDRLTLTTNLGVLDGRMQDAEGDAAVLWVFGAGGGLGGPAGGLYTRLGARLRERGVASLELDYRKAGVLRDCTIDALVGAAYLRQLEKERVVLVGHSFGGAVVIAAAAVTDYIVGVAALSSQTFGTEAVDELAPRPVIFIHGSDDDVLSERCSHDLYARAREPKELIIYPDCRHGLDECSEQLDQDLLGWLERVLEL